MGLFQLHRSDRIHRKRRLGASAVEFAVVAPVFFLLVFGIIEFGRMVMVQQMMTNAAREGARRAVLSGATANEVNTTIVNYMASANLNVTTTDITLDPTDPGAAEYGDPITVTLTVPFSRVSWMPSPLYLGNTNLSAQAIMRRESVQGGGS